MDIIVRVFASGPGNQGSFPGRVMPKTQKMILDAFWLNILHYELRIKGKWRNFLKSIAPSPTPHCRSYSKSNLRVRPAKIRHKSIILK